MADGEWFLQNLITVMKADNGLKTCTGTTIVVPIDISEFTPIGNRYPQITLHLNEGSSETVFPAGWYRLIVNVWIEKNTMSQPYLRIRQYIKEINRICNRKASSLSKIDINANEGLRVARCVKSSGDIRFVRETGLYYGEVIFDVVQSEGESFDPADAGNKEWV